MLFVGRESRGGARVLPGGASLSYRSIGLLDKNFAEILAIFRITQIGRRPTLVISERRMAEFAIAAAQ